MANRCPDCRAKIQSPLALYCSKCGASLVARYQLPPAEAPSAWKSIPALVRFGIWLIVIPPLMWFGCAACAILAGLSAHY